MASTGSSIPSHKDARPTLYGSTTTARSLYEDFALPVIHLDGDGDGSPGTTGENIMMTGRGNCFTVTPIATQTIPFLTWTLGSGIDLSSGDDTDGDGWEIHNGVGAANPYSFVVGTAKPQYASVTLTISDVSEFDELAIGFRKTAEANEAAIDNYTDMAVLNIGAGANDGTIDIETILNDAATTNTPTTQSVADAGTVTLTVICDSDGSLYGKKRAVYYEINGAEPTAVPATLFRFDDGDRLFPFLHALQDETGGAATVFVSKLEWGEWGFSNATQPKGQSLSYQRTQTL